jgi:hypothetical protein
MLYPRLFLVLLSAYLLFLGRSRAQTPVDASTLNGKFMLGYQAWHACQGDGNPVNKYIHWGHADNARPATNDVLADIWADTSEFAGSELFPASLVLGNGQPAKAYSCFVSNTVARHFRWMRDYGVDGVMVQRFIKDVKIDASWAALRNTNMVFARAGAEAYGRLFCVMYDMSNDDPAQVINHLQTDWAYLTATVQITNSARYAKHKGKPVVAVWGLGFSGVAVPPADAQTIINFFKSAGCTVMGGVPYNWRSLTADSQTNAAWAAVYRSFDVLSPWAVGRYSTMAQADNFKTSTLVPDLSECLSNNIDYMPVVFPGYSAHNLGGGPLNSIPRLGGRFFWKQIFNAASAGCTMIYGAMFDEIDEGTALYKLAPTMNETPAVPVTNAYQFFSLNADGETLPSDWYLRVTGKGTLAVHHAEPLNATLPITPTNGLTVLSPNGGNTWTAGAPATVTWSTTGAVGNVTIDLSTDGGSTFRSLVYNVSNSGSRALIVPYYASTNCRIRIQSTNGAPVDWSDTAFTIKVVDTNANIDLQPLFGLAPGSRSYLPDSTGNAARGLAYCSSRDELYLVNITSLAVNVIDGSSGADKWILSVGGVTSVGSGSGFSLDKVGVTGDGVIYAGNVRVSVSDVSAPFKLYRWANSSIFTSPSVAYSGTAGFPPGTRVGDTLAVRGAGTNTQILVGARNVNTVSLLTTTNGTNFSASLITTDANANQIGGCLAFGIANSFWGATNGLPPARFDFDPVSLVATTAQSFAATAVSPGTGAFSADPPNSLIALVTLVDGADQLNVYDIVAEVTSPTLLASWPVPGYNDNNFGLGEVCFGGDRLYALDTNNGLLAFRLIFPGGPVTLSARLLGSNVRLSWPAAARGFLIERRNSAGSGSWQPVPDLVNLNGTEHVATPTATGDSQFYRLRKP